MSDEAGIIIMVNSEIERLFGYRREELIGRSVDVLVPERLRRQHVRYRDDYAHHPERRPPAGHSRDLIGLRQDGSEFPVEIGLDEVHARRPDRARHDQAVASASFAVAAPPLLDQSSPAAWSRWRCA